MLHSALSRLGRDPARASVLSHYKIQFRKRSDTELVCDCPLPSHAESSHKGTFAVSIVKGKFYCHSDKCRAASNKPKGGDIVDLVQILENLPNPLDAAKRIKEMFCVVGTDTYNPPSKPLTNPPLAFKLKDIQHDHPFILQRGISIEMAQEFGVGYFPGKGSMAGRVVFPLYVDFTLDPNNPERDCGDGPDIRLLGYEGRATEPLMEPKWKLPAGLHRTFLYGLEKCGWGYPLILLESFWGVLWFHQHGRHAAALMGKSMTDAQEAWLDPYLNITVAMDNDEPGREASVKLVERLKQKSGRKVSVAYIRE
jgi:hypothetical protein